MSDYTRVVVDAMGGDNAPFEIVKGVVLSAEQNPNVELVLVGDTDKINNCFFFKKRGL